MDPRALTSGECFNSFDALNSSGFAVASCQLPHDQEVYYRYTLPGGRFPGRQSAWDTASSTCGARLAGYVGPGQGSVFSEWPFTPDQAEWASGDHVAVCVLARIDDMQITGSVRHTH